MSVNKFDSLDNLTRDICIGMQDYDCENYVPVLRTIIRVLDQFNVKILPNLKSFLIQMNDNNTITLPKDVIQVNKVGFCLGEKVVQLGRKSKIDRPNLALAPNDLVCSCDHTKISDIIKEDSSNSELIESSCNACLFRNAYLLNSQYVGELYGYPASQFAEGNWSYEENDNRIIFDNGSMITSGDYYLVECRMTNGPEQMKYIPKKLFPAVRTRAMQWIYEGAGEMGKAQNMNHQFKIEWVMLIRTYENFSLEDWMAAINGQYIASPKV